jgi:hypothetical protein
MLIRSVFGYLQLGMLGKAPQDRPGETRGGTARSLQAPHAWVCVWSDGASLVSVLLQFEPDHCFSTDSRPLPCLFTLLFLSVNCKVFYYVSHRNPIPARPDEELALQFAEQTAIAVSAFFSSHGHFPFSLIGRTARQELPCITLVASR